MWNFRRPSMSPVLLHLVLVFAIVSSQSLEQPLCSRLGNFYESNCPSQIERSGLVSRQGFPGKRGAVGERGERGLKGSKGSKGTAGEANYDRVQNMILERMEGYCPIVYNGSCFWVAVRFSPQITFYEGREICEAQGCQPANIYSEVHYNLMMEYLRTLTMKDKWMYVWLGMTYNTQMSAAILSDGARAPFVKWYAGYPKSARLCCNIYLQAGSDWKTTSQHMITLQPSSTVRGVMCEK